MPNLHHLAELRSLAYHRVVASRLAAEPELVEDARALLQRWLASEGRASDALRRWEALLARPPGELAAFLVDTGHEATELRQSSPFAGALAPRDRWRIWREVRAEFEATL